MQTEHMTPYSLIETEYRTTKAACLAKQAMEAGMTRDLIRLLDGSSVRQMLLATTPRPDNRKGEARWSSASEQTWTEVRAILQVMA